MAITKETHPYELTIRYDKTGTLDTIKYRESTCFLEGGAHQTMQIGRARALEVDGRELAGLLTQAQNDALALITTANEEREAALTDKAELETEKRALEVAAEEREDEIRTLRLKGEDNG